LKREENTTVNAVCDENIDPFFQPKRNAPKDTQEKILAIPIDVFSGDSKLVSGLGNGFGQR
jgi:hypothetical protein